MKRPEDAKKRGQSREEIWALIRKLKTFTAGDLAAINLDNTTLYAYLRGLVASGYLVRETCPSKPGFPVYLYRIIKDAVEPPRVKEDGTETSVGSGRKALWRTMKILKSFTLTDLVACSSTPDHAVASEEARTYMLYLERAGYIKRLSGKSTATGIFKLVRWTGPRPPMIQRIKQVWDPNLKQVVWPKEQAQGERAKAKVKDEAGTRE